jgi:hypothetical protein
MCRKNFVVLSLVNLGLDLFIYEERISPIFDENLSLKLFMEEL